VTHSDQPECAIDESMLALGVQPPIASPPVPIIELPGKEGRSRKGMWSLFAGVVLVAGLGYFALPKLIPALWRSEDRLRNVPRMTVAKVDLSTVLTAWGRIESSQNTIISCELERLEIRTRGQSMSSGGSSTILTLIDEGTLVKKGDVLCTLESSEYEELVRTQEIKTEQAAAAMMQAQLSFEVAELSVREYREGLYKQQLQSFEGTIALAESDMERAIDRLEWTKKMLGKGYASLATKSGAEQTLNECRFDLMSSRLERNNFLEFGNTKTLMELSSEVEKRRFEAMANTQRVTRNREQLAQYKRMVELCTIRAPHDGFLIYASDPTKPYAAAIEPGQSVRQSQKLFFLPDLEKMEVRAYIHESVASRVREGMRARAKIEGLENRMLEGTVVSVAPLPSSTNWFSDEVKYFVGVVKLDTIRSGLKPGMTAEVEFDVERCSDVLAVPCEAVTVEGGHDFCYVAGIDGLERRPVTLGRSTRDLLEVTKGLAVGDQVVLQPEKLGVLDSIAAHPSRESGFDESPASDSPAPSGAPVSVE
jgi:HlyD family secretion protein